MTAPAIAAWRFGAGLVLGGCLGLFYGFLRPPRQKHPHLCDLLLGFALLGLWCFYGFGLCRGDLRFGYSLALPLGALLWESTAGRALQPLIFRFWQIICGFSRLLCRPVKVFLKKIQVFTKFLFSSGKKWFTIKCDKQKRGGPNNGRKK